MIAWQNINWELFIIAVTALLGIITLLKSILQNRHKTILEYYEKTQELREKVDFLSDSKSKKLIEKATSLFNQTINYYNVLSYLILRGVVDEGDAFKVLKKNIFALNERCVKRKIESERTSYLTKLCDRWERWGLSTYYFSFTLKIIVLVIVIMLLLYTLSLQIR